MDIVKANLAIARHKKFLEACSKNYSYFYFGKNLSWSYDRTAENLIDWLTSTLPNPHDPTHALLRILFKEIAKSKVVVSVRPDHPFHRDKACLAFAKSVEEYLSDLNSKAEKHLREILFNLLNYSFAVLHTDGTKIFPLGPGEFIPGSPDIRDLNNQPFVLRLSYQYNNDVKDIWADLETPVIQVREIYSLPEKLRIVYQEDWKNGKEYPLKVNRYPFGVASDSVETHNFYSLPLVTRLIAKIDEVRTLSANVSKSSHTLANPILTYDEEASINVQKLLTQLRVGDKNIILGKRAGGSIGYLQPAPLPVYFLEYLRTQILSISEDVGITSAAWGRLGGGFRERGAVEAVIRASLSSLEDYAPKIARAFADINEYLLSKILSDRLKFLRKGVPLPGIESLLVGKARNVTFSVQTELKVPMTRTISEEAMILSKLRNRVISHRQALIELGYTKPELILREIIEEELQRQEAARPQLREEVIRERLNKSLTKPFELKMIDQEKYWLKVAPEEAEKAKFFLADLINYIFLETEGSPPPTPAKEPVPKEQEPANAQLLTELLAKAQPPVKPEAEPGAEPETAAESNTLQPEVKKVVRPRFSRKLQARLVALRKPVKPTSEILNLPGLYLVEPHARDVWAGRKTLIIKSKNFNIINQEYLLLGAKVYGVIKVHHVFPLKEGDFEKLARHHLITESQRKKWWGNKQLYGYQFEFHPFDVPFEYQRKPGVQTFVSKVELRSEKVGVPYTGDLKPVKLTYFGLIPPHKPEKKAFASYEIFKADRLREVLPEGKYNVSEKLDGVRATLHKRGKKVKIFSDEGRIFPQARVNHIAQKALELFKKHDVILDGEMMLEGKRHQDITGYLHSKGEPDPEEQKKVYFSAFDILMLNEKSLASKPFYQRAEILSAFIKPGERHQALARVRSVNVKRDEVAEAVKKYSSEEGAIIRDIEASYWATHSTYKYKHQVEIDVQVIAVEKTKLGLPIYFCALRDGTYIGQTYASKEVKAKEGDVIRVSVTHFTLKPDGSLGWFSPRPAGLKRTGSVKGQGLVLDLSRPDTLSFVREHFLLAGSQEEWDKWLIKHREWRKKKMPALIDRIKTMIKEGKSAAQT